MSTATIDTIVPTGTWTVDPAHSSVGFAVKHMGIATVRGVFNEFQGALEVGEDGVARVYGTVAAASVDTGEPQRDEHLRSADFFEAEVHPGLVYESREIEATGDDTYRITGDLTLHGVTRELVLDAEVTGSDLDMHGNTRVGLEVRGELSRADYGIKFNAALGSGNMLVGDKVKITLDISAIKE